MLYASVAQSVVHLTRNEKVACSSQVTSSTKTSTPNGVDVLLLLKILMFKNNPNRAVWEFLRLKLQETEEWKTFVFLLHTL